MNDNSGEAARPVTGYDIKVGKTHQQSTSFAGSTQMAWDMPNEFEQQAALADGLGTTLAAQYELRPDSTYVTSEGEIE